MKNQIHFLTLLLFLCCGLGFNIAHAASSVTVWYWGGEGDAEIAPVAAQNGVTAIAVGGYHYVALKIDGTVAAWGRNDYSQTSVPAALSGVTAISAGGIHTVALKLDGTVAAWGAGNSTNNWLNYGQATVPTNLTGVTAIAAGGYHTLALKGDGSVTAWGVNGNGQTDVPTAAQSGVTAIAAGTSHSVALKSDGSVLAWGRNVHYQATVPITAQSGVTAIAAGEVHTVALKNDGSVVVWGGGCCYLGGLTNVPVAAQSGVRAIAAGAFHVVALKNDGTVVTWGYYEEDEYFEVVDLPPGLSGVTAIAAGGQHSAAILNPTAVSFTNAVSITIPDHGAASPYPSTIDVGGINYQVQEVVVGLSGLSHTFASDIDILLVGPSGQSVVLMAGTGGGSSISNVNLTFDDAAPTNLPVAGPILSGSYKPTTYSINASFPLPAPAGPHGPALSVFSGTDPNGTWKLFVVDEEEEDMGVIASGWSLTFVGLNGGPLPSCRSFGTWVSRASGTTNTLNDVAYGNGRFVAVGGNFSVATSTNGVDWTTQFIASGIPLNSVSFGNGLFVAAGGSGFIRTSINGTTWSTIQISSAHLNGVAWGGGTFVAVGTNGTILTSANGTNWTSRSSFVTNVLSAVTYGNGRFVAVGNSGYVLVSTNGGTNWTSRAAGTLMNLTDVTFGGTFVAVGASGTILNSIDGLSWTARSLGTGVDFSSVTVDGSRFVAVGNSTNAAYGLVTSTDGVSWIPSQLPRTAFWNDVVYGTSDFVVVGQGGAILLSGQPPYIAGQPQSRAVCVADPVSFSVTMASGCPLTYQWRLNGTNIPGATSSNLSIAAVRVEDAGGRSEERRVGKECVP